MWQRKPALKFVVLILGGVSVAVLSARTAQAQTSLGRTPVLVVYVGGVLDLPAGG